MGHQPLHLLFVLRSLVAVPAYVMPPGPARANVPPARSSPRLSAQAATPPAMVEAQAPAAAPKRRGVPTLVPALAVATAVGWQLTTTLATMDGAVSSSVKLIYAGAVAGIISRTCCAPLEMVSTVMMCLGDDSKGMWVELRNAWRSKGLPGLFKGNGANCLKVAPSRGTQFLVYEAVKRQLLASGAFAGGLTAGARLFAGGVAGMVAAALVYPLETVKTVMTLYPDDCSSILGTLKMVAKKAGGIGGLYRGLLPTLVAMFPYVGVEFMVYETLKARYASAFGVAPGLAMLLFLGALSGAAAQAAAHPLDVVRRRMQMQGMGKAAKGQRKISNMVGGLYGIAKDEGVHVLYRGLGPASLEKAPSTAIGYIIYEGMKSALRVASV